MNSIFDVTVRVLGINIPVIGVDLEGQYGSS